MSDKYLITGATGFIGANITRELTKQKKDVSIIVRDKKLNWRLKDIAPQLKIYEKDILDPEIQVIIKEINPDYIFHLATYGVYQNQKDWDGLIKTNIKGTINLLEAAKRINFKRFINTGSCFEYGEKKQKIRESDILEPLTDYGITKSAATLYCQKEALLHNLPIITLRPFTGFGYYEDKNRLVLSVISSALKNAPIEVGSLENSRNFTFIEDIIDAYISTVEKKCEPGQIINIASKKPHSVGDVVDTIIKLTKSSSEIVHLGKQLQHWEAEPRGWDVDILKAKKMLNWEPKNDLTKGLKKTIEWFKTYSYLYN